MGETLLFSVSVGGAGVALDSAGNAYVGGGGGLQPDALDLIAPSLPALGGRTAAMSAPDQFSLFHIYASLCLAGRFGDGRRSHDATYIQGSNLTLSGVALSGAQL